jgi:adenosylcobinamide-GDP ribazoletransferase
MLRPLLGAIGFLTRIPVPAQVHSDADMARAAGFFAWVGGLLALALWGAAQLAPSAGTRLTAVLVVGVWAWITGGLHLDGLADTVDGFSGGRGQHERTLEIMRDSRIGAHGALALVLALLLKATALERLLELQSWSWLLAPVAARFLCTVLIARFRYIRAKGLGSAFVARVGALELGLGAAGLGAALGIAFYCGQLQLALAWALLAALLVAWGVGLVFQRRLGGLTGDGYGAAIELSEVACLVVLCLR